MARADDAATLKMAVVGWIDSMFGLSDPALRPKYKDGRGLDNDHCGRLLCPAEYDWDDVR
jgi:hypothetical protein